MLILNLIQHPLDFLSFVIALSTSVAFHESAHAYVADRLGDPTAKNLGRISLNPLKHFDPWGTIFFFLAGFGWGIPVPIDPRNFKNPKLDSLKVALAGPASNFLIALLLAMVLRILPLSENLSHLVLVMVSLNIVWMIFNLLPIPPLDGSHLLELVLSPSSYAILQRLGLPILIILLFFSPYLQVIISGGLSLFLKIFVGVPFSPF